MSVIAYANMLNAREETPPNEVETAKATKTGTKDYVVVLAGLIAVEALALHVFVVDATTDKAEDGTTTVITEASTLKWAFYGLIALAVFLYVTVHFKNLDGYDVIRAAIPAAAFVAWTMAQPVTAFDAVAPDMSTATRGVIPAFAAVVLGVLATGLTTKADQKEAPTTVPEHLAS
jgi:hypothetical protein